MWFFYSMHCGGIDGNNGGAGDANGARFELNWGCIKGICDQGQRFIVHKSLINFHKSKIKRVCNQLFWSLVLIVAIDIVHRSHIKITSHRS